MSVAALVGCSVVVAADHRSLDVASALERQGAAVRSAPMLGVVARADTAELLARTAQVIATPPDIVIVTTDLGFWGWMDAAHAGGVDAALAHSLRDASFVGRSTGTRGGFAELRAMTAERPEELRSYLQTAGVTGKRIVVQRQGAGSEGVDEMLVEAGAEVVSVPAHHWGPPPDPAAAQRAAVQAGAGEVDAVLFASAAAAASWLAVAARTGVIEEIRRRAAGGRLLLASTSPIAAGPLRAEGLHTVVSDSGTGESLARCVIAHFGGADARTLPTDAGRLEVRSGGALIDDRFVPLSRTSASLLEALFIAGGRVLSRVEIARALPGPSRSGHAVEAAVARLRDALSGADLVQTVVKRGYRLAVTGV